MSRKLRICICAGLLALNIAFIWGNSAMPGAASQGLSDGMLDRFSFLKALLGPNAGRIIRKIAHFGEFGCLGLLWTRLWQLLGQGRFHRISLAALSGLIVSCVDETIQIFALNRSSSLMDVWLDMAGVSAGIIFHIFGQYLFRKRKNTI